MAGIIKFRTQINQIERKRIIQRINKTRSWFFEKINMIDKSLARLTRGHRDSIQIKKIRNEMEKITETEEIQKEFYSDSHSTKKECIQQKWKIRM